jgi:iron complex outermembrane receptor protein
MIFRGLLLFAVPALGSLADAADFAPKSVQTVTVLAPSEDDEAPGRSLALHGWSTGRSLTAIDADDLDTWAPLRLEDLTGLIPGAVVEPLNAGLSTAVKVRGFAVSRLHYGSMPDIQRLFSRDLATVARVEVLGGNAATALGITSPGGAIRYLGKRPTATPFVTAALQAGSHGHVRATLDTSGPLGAIGSGLRYRAIAAVEDGQQGWASLPRRRQTGMLTLTRTYDHGEFGIDLQAQHNKTPFSFGTVITNAGPAGTPARPADVAWDRLLVLDGGAPTQRHYRQLVAHWRHAFDGGATLQADLSAARVTRDETLIGYWTLVSPDAVSSYFTEYRDQYRQGSGRLELQLPMRVGRWQHDVRLGTDAYHQQFLFKGDQHIGAIVAPVDAPDFSALVDGPPERWPRYNDERIVERAAWIANRARLGDTLELSAAVRRQHYGIGSDRVGTGRVRVAGAAATTSSAGLDWTFAADWRAWASRASGMEPNRGMTATGQFLPAQRSRQSELGLQWRGGRFRTSAAVWRIDLDNVAMTDPADRTAVIAAGSRQVDGIEWRADWRVTDWSFSANAAGLRSRHRVKTSSSLGEQFVGVPGTTGGFQFKGPIVFPGRIPATLAIFLTGVGSRMGNAANTVRVPGYVRIDSMLNLRWRQHEWFAGVRNLGDIRYVEAVTAVDDVFQGARRQWWVGVKLAI